MQFRGEPLFVLKYQKRRLILWVVAALFQMFFIYFVLFVAVVSSMLDFIMTKLAALFLFSILASILADMLLFKEIRFYRDRIVKEWRLAGSRELLLAEVGLISQSSPGWGIGAKCFFKEGMGPFWRFLMSFVHQIGG
ncbi:MAG: hypothetical protein WBG50_02735 [Desulfomonilaceae bacterium]